VLKYASVAGTLVKNLMPCRDLPRRFLSMCRSIRFESGTAASEQTSLDSLVRASETGRHRGSTRFGTCLSRPTHLPSPNLVSVRFGRIMRSDGMSTLVNVQVGRDGPGLAHILGGSPCAV
jgi:hypothetical protein